MATWSLRPDDDPGFDPLAERIRAWWLGVLTGEPGQDHPVYGSAISARVRGDELVVRGVVRSEEEAERISGEAAGLVGRGVGEVRNEIKVDSPDRGEQGLLVQVLVSVFENRNQALIAGQLVAAHPELAPHWLHVAGEPADELPDLGLPSEATDLICRSLDEGRAVLVVQVDELEAFKTRSLLDEETLSLQTLVLPPHPAEGAVDAPDPGAE